MSPRINPEAHWFSIGEAEQGGTCPLCDHKLHVMIRSAFEGKFKIGCPLDGCRWLPEETHDFAQCPDA